MTSQQNVGIDYGMGTTNRDPMTGIRYGVIPQGEVSQAWSDESEGVYPEFDPDNTDHCDCERDDDGDLIAPEDCRCEESFNDCTEVMGFTYDQEGYKAECGEDGDIFITLSPFYTRAQFCSPCAPGAGYLMNPCEDGPKAYCFGHDWFEGGKAPYPVYRVSDDSLVAPE